MKTGLVIVAHPDDETLWFGGTLRRHTDIHWTIASVTYAETTGRGRDFLRACQQFPAHGLLLGYEDTPGPILDEPGLERRLRNLARCQPWAVVLTHNQRGEYGHVHHRQVARLVKKVWPRAIQCGFGADQIDAIVPLPAEVWAWKRRLVEIYTDAGKGERLKLYPPFGLDYEPLVIGEAPQLEWAVRLAAPVAWKSLSGGQELAKRGVSRHWRIAILADSPGWAHDVIATELKQTLPPEYAVDIYYLFNADYSQQRRLALDPQDYDLIHLMSWRHWGCVAEQAFPARKLVTTVHGHRQLERLPPLLPNFAAISTVSQKLHASLQTHAPGCQLTPCGVDTQSFYPLPHRGRRRFTFGAVGRAYTGEPEDVKGWHAILEPLAEELACYRANYLRIDRAARLPHTAMPAYYRRCDCYLCASRTEGNPLPLLEAAACGLPLLSTDAGIAPEIIAEDNGYLLPRTRAAFSQAVRTLANQPERRRMMGNCSRQKMLAGRDWWALAPHWASFYESAL